MSEVQRTPSAPGAHLPAPAVFLGALASEVNEPDILSPAYAAVADLTERIVSAVRSCQLGEQEAAGYLQALRVTDGVGVQWAVGATSLRWYRKVSDGAWRLAVPPQEADEAADLSSAEAIAVVPDHVLDLIGAQGRDWESGGYAADPFAAAPAPAAPWEFEVGDDRRLQSYGDVSFGA